MKNWKIIGTGKLKTLINEKCENEKVKSAKNLC